MECRGSRNGLSLKSLKGFLVLSFLMAGVFGIAETGQAIPFTDTYDAGHIRMKGSLLRPDDSISWTFDITDDGFDPLTQDVLSAEVVLNLEDDGGRFDFFEIAMLNVGENTFSWEVDSGNTTFMLTSLMVLSDTGTVDCTLTAGLGDFYFNSAVLRGEATAPRPAATPTPEPATLFLFGSGLLGLSALRSRFG